MVSLQQRQNATLRQFSLLKFLLVLVAIASLGLATLSHYGISSDERTEIRIVEENVDLVTQNDPIVGDIIYYGTFFNFLAEGAFRLEETLRYGAARYPLHCAQEKPCFKPSLLARIAAKHRLTFLFSLLGYGAIAGIVGLLCGWEYAWFSPLVLALFPRFWGHSFFNPKDSPFAALFLLCTYAGAYVVDRYLNVKERQNLVLLSLGYGVLVGLLTAIRLGGFILLFFVASAYFFLASRPGNSWRAFKKVLAGSLSMGVAWAVTVTVLHPASWANPPLWFFQAIKYLARHGWDKNVLFNGDYIRAPHVPWFYLPTWVAITTPVIFLIAFIVGLVLLSLKYSKLSSRQRACFILILLQVFCLPLIAMVKGSTLYDGLRQFLFILPGIAAIATAGFIEIYRRLPQKRMKLFAIALTFCLFLPIVFDMAALHPYEYIYFNRAFGGIKQADRRYETDYWGLSVREAMEGFNRWSEPNARLVVGTPFNTTFILSKDDTRVSELNYDYQKMKIAAEQPPLEKPYYFLAIPKHGLDRLFPECNEVNRIERQGVPLTTIRKCD